MFSASLDEIVAKASENSHTYSHTLDSLMEDGAVKASFHKNTNNHN